jgi:uncharacterized SAM-binding protein YcdF (DUF218 family)
LFFILSKTFGALLLPTNLLIGVGVVGAVLLVTRFAALGRKLVMASVLLLVVCGLSPLGTMLLYPLEQRFPPWDAARGAPDGIIVLGASIEGRSFRRPRHPGGAQRARSHHRGGGTGAPLSQCAHRLLGRQRQRDFERRTGGRFRRRRVRKPRRCQIAADHGTAFAQHGGERRILQGTGGAEGGRTLAAGDVGLPHAAIRRLVPKSRIRVEPYPVDWRVGGRGDLLSFTNIATDGLGRTDLAVREWMGLIAYRATGKIDDLAAGTGAEVKVASLN